MSELNGFRWEPKDENVLGRGSFATVYKGQRNADGMTVAVKVMKIDAREEIAIMRPLAHPNIVKMLEAEGNILVLEFCNAKDLEVFLAGNGCMRDEAVRNFGLQMAGGLDHLKTHGVTHRDIKPRNIFVHRTSDGLVFKLGDFGVSRTKELMSTIAGTPLFMAPEIYIAAETAQDQSNASYTSSADMWSLGCCFHYCITGAPPFPALTLKELRALTLQPLRDVEVASKFGSLSPPYQALMAAVVCDLVQLDVAKRLNPAALRALLSSSLSPLGVYDLVREQRLSCFVFERAPTANCFPLLDSVALALEQPMADLLLLAEHPEGIVEHDSARVPRDGASSPADVIAVNVSALLDEPAPSDDDDEADDGDQFAFSIVGPGEWLDGPGTDAKVLAPECRKLVKELVQPVEQLLWQMKAAAAAQRAVRHRAASLVSLIAQLACDSRSVAALAERLSPDQAALLHRLESSIRELEHLTRNNSADASLQPLSAFLLQFAEQSATLSTCLDASSGDLSLTATGLMSGLLKCYSSFAPRVKDLRKRVRRDLCAAITKYIALRDCTLPGGMLSSSQDHVAVLRGALQAAPVVERTAFEQLLVQLDGEVRARALAEAAAKEHEQRQADAQAQLSALIRDGAALQSRISALEEQLREDSSSHFRQVERLEASAVAREAALAENLSRMQTAAEAKEAALAEDLSRVQAKEAALAEDLSRVQAGAAAKDRLNSEELSRLQGGLKAQTDEVTRLREAVAAKDVALAAHVEEGTRLSNFAMTRAEEVAQLQVRAMADADEIARLQARAKADAVEIAHVQARAKEEIARVLAAAKKTDADGMAWSAAIAGKDRELACLADQVQHLQATIAAKEADLQRVMALADASESHAQAQAMLLARMQQLRSQDLDDAREAEKAILARAIAAETRAEATDARAAAAEAAQASIEAQRRSRDQQAEVEQGQLLAELDAYRQRFAADMRVRDATIAALENEKTSKDRRIQELEAAMRAAAEQCESLFVASSASAQQTADYAALDSIAHSIAPLLSVDTRSVHDRALWAMVREQIASKAQRCVLLSLGNFQFGDTAMLMPNGSMLTGGAYAGDVIRVPVDYMAHFPSRPCLVDIVSVTQGGAVVEIAAHFN